MTTPPSSLPSSAPASRPRRGAPSGNHNALKHGFYSNRFSPADLRDLDLCRDDCLAHEIRLLRVYTRRFVEAAQDQSSYTELASILRTLCLASSTLTRLLRTEKVLKSWFHY